MLKFLPGVVFFMVMLFIQTTYGAELIIRHKTDGENKILLPDDGKSTVERTLDLGEVWHGTVQISGLKTKGPLAIEMRYETSMVISDEGPHIVLTDWKHYQSSWITLKRINESRFAMPELSDKQQSQFPFVSHNEVLDTIGKSDKVRKVYWQKMAEECKTPTSYPCDVKITKIWLKIFSGENALDKKLLKEVILIPPTGG